MKKRFIPVICGILTAFAVGTVNADDVLSKEEIADRLWEDMWFGNDDDGTVFPEASYKHHLLTEWIDENYSNNEDYDWSNIGRIGYQYSDYYSDLTENWLFTDENDQWYITDEETGMVYHFSMFQGEWNMIDSNGDTVDIFEPFSTIETADDKPAVYDDNGNTDNHKVVAENKEAACQKVSEWTADKDNKNGEVVTEYAAETTYTATQDAVEENTNTIPVIAGVLAVCALAGTGAFVYSRKKG